MAYAQTTPVQVAIRTNGTHNCQIKSSVNISFFAKKFETYWRVVCATQGIYTMQPLQIRSRYKRQSQDSVIRTVKVPIF